MSSQPQRTFSKKQIQTIIKIVFLESMLIIFVLPTNQSTGEIPPVNSYQTGFFSPVGTGPSGSIWTVSFGKTYSVIPQVSIGYTKPILQFVIPNCPVGCQSLSVNYTDTFTFISNPIGIAWTNMPLAQTELFGNTNSEIQADINGTTLYKLEATCPTPSTHSGAHLFLQSRNNGGAWDNVSTSPNNVMFVDASCTTPPAPTSSTGWLKIQFGNPPFYNSCIPPTINCGIEFRIMGANGGGLGDNPIFSEIRVDFYRSVPFALWFDPILTNLVVGTSSFNITATWQDAPSFHKPEFFWIAQCFC